MMTTAQDDAGTASSRALATKNPWRGRWSGWGRQSDGPRWPMQVRWHSAEPGLCAEATYADGDCSAEWTCEGAVAGLMSMTESLRTGADKCLDGGKMRARMSPAGDKIEWEWSNGPVSATATLLRE